ncbi:hypothetical protein [Flavobacterium sp. TSSA_36]|uniref:hypothetical protein n=1 Tax=Flavobacterium sp. TSSA_36 TaxID=3447669 RepID=UPI003F3CDD0A
MKENKWLYNGAFKGMKGIILESRGGAKKSNAQRNPDYKLLLQYVLENLKNNHAKGVEIYIASTREAKYPTLSDRMLTVDGLSTFDFTYIDIDPFITKLSKEIKTSGQSGSEKGGNSTKRLFFHLSTGATEILPMINRVIPKEVTNAIDSKKQITKALEAFTFDFKRDKNKSQGELKILVTELQDCLKDHLEKTVTNYQWETEFKTKEGRKDSFDIYGYSKELNEHIVVELDPHRADSIAKKFVSRLALMIDKNLLYIAYLYPGTDKMPINEANKYLGDCETILEAVNGSSGFQKQFLGFFLN